MIMKMHYNHVAIEDRIVNLNQGDYQRLCEAFLYKLGYHNVYALGSFSGTTKTTPGTPDAFVPQSNGKYVFCEVTTQKRSLTTKILADLKKCIDEVSLGIKTSKIEKLFYFHTSTNLNVDQIEKINCFCEDNHIPFVMYNPTDLALKIQNEYRSLSTEYLNLPLDTNQILDVEDFADVHDRNDLTAKIQIPFLFREKELKEIKESFNTCKVVLLTGDAGVGKTRLAWEIANQFKCTGGCHVYCIKNNGCSLHEDFQISFEQPGKYFLLIDDANEVNELVFILNYCNDRKYNVKILATVRNYACENVFNIVQQYANSVIVSLARFTDDEIKEFLRKNLNILNDAYIDQIVKICEGNPRLAYIAGEYAKKEGTLASINDSSKFYTAYYTKYFSETKLSTNKQLLKTACIMSIVSGIQLDSLSYLTPFFTLFEISEESFKECIHNLNNSEVINIQSNVTRIVEQSLANYVLYYTFIEKKIISISDFIKDCFLQFQSTVINSINMILSLFYTDVVKDYICSEVNIVWEYFEQKDASTYEKFILAFHSINPIKALCYINSLIVSSQGNSIPIENIDFDKFTSYENDKILALLSGYRNTDEVLTAVELIIKYTLTNPSVVKQAYSVLISHYIIEKESYEQDYRVENAVVEILVKYFSNEIIQQLFIAVSSYLLQLFFSHSRDDRKMTISIYSGIIVLTEGSKKYRGQIWNKLKEVCADKKYVSQIIKLLRGYYSGWNSKVRNDLLEFDKQYVVELVKLLPNEYRITKASIANGLISRWNLHKVTSINCFEDDIAIPEWHIRNVFTGINSERVWSDNLRGYRRSLINEFFKRGDDIFSTVKIIDCIAKEVPDEKIYLYEGLVDAADILTDNNELLITFIKACMSCSEIIYTVPDRLLCKLFARNSVDDIYNLLFTECDNNQYLWEYAFFVCLPEEKVTIHYYNLFIEVITDVIKQRYSISSFLILDKFIIQVSAVYCNVANIIIENSEKPDFSPLFYEKNPDSLLQLFESDEKLLKNVYFFSIKYNHNIDRDGKYIIYFINQDINWLYQYMDFVIADTKYLAYDDEHERLSGCWMLDNWKEIFDFLFYSSTKKERVEYDFSFSFMHNLFSPVGIDYQDLRQRQKEWFLHIITDNFSDEEKVVSIFELISQFDENMRIECIKHLLSLNTNVSVFKKLTLVNQNECWMGSDIPILVKKKNFYKKLMTYISEIQYLAHKTYIKEMIDYYDQRIEKSKTQQFLGYF